MPDFKSSALTLGPTFSTLLNSKPEDKDLVRLSLISPIKLGISLSYFSNFIK